MYPPTPLKKFLPPALSTGGRRSLPRKSFLVQNNKRIDLVLCTLFEIGSTVQLQTFSHDAPHSRSQRPRSSCARNRFLAQTRRIAASGNENGRSPPRQGPHNHVISFALQGFVLVRSWLFPPRVVDLSGLISSPAFFTRMI